MFVKYHDNLRAPSGTDSHDSEFSAALMSLHMHSKCEGAIIRRTLNRRQFRLRTYYWAFETQVVYQQKLFVLCNHVSESGYILAEHVGLRRAVLAGIMDRDHLIGCVRLKWLLDAVMDYKLLQLIAQHVLDA